MKKKHKITSEKIIELYMNDVLLLSEPHSSVYAFAKRHDFEESEFYQHFSSFENIEKFIFASFCDQAIILLEQSKEYIDFNEKQKLLSFYYTFFEILSANRSYVVTFLQKHRSKLKSLKSLSRLKESYLSFVDGLDLEKIDFKKERFNSIQDKGFKEAAWVQLLVVLEFWLNDESKGFEKTDIFIEKSIRATFDLISIAPIKSVVDLVKFVWKEKMNV